MKRVCFVVLIGISAILFAQGQSIENQLKSIDFLMKKEKYSDSMSILSTLKLQTNVMNRTQLYSLYLKSGMCYYQSWKINDAERDWLVALAFAESAIQNEDVMNNLAKMYYASKMYDKAEAFYMKLVGASMSSNYCEYLYYLAKIKAKLKRPDAEQFFQRVINEYPNHQLKKYAEIELKKKG